VIIKIARTDKELSANAGLVIFKELANSVGIDRLLADVVPRLKFGSAKNIRKFRQLLLAFQAGADCLEDLDKLAEDEAFQAVCGGKVYSSKAFGDFLRSFSEMHCKRLNHRLIELALGLRQQLFADKTSVVIDIDSTTNEQHAKKMEGVCANYAGVSGLDSIQAFTEEGFQLWHDVRPGNTHTARGAQEIIHEIFNRMPKAMAHLTRYVRADSGFCKLDFFEACAAKSAQFVVCMRKLMYKPLIKTVGEWKPQGAADKDRIIFVGGRECEVGETLYTPKNSTHTLRVVLIRAVKLGREAQLVKGDDDYDYQGWVSSISHAIDAVDVIKLYRGRGHAENFIRELKNGLDLHHYPCQKLVANKAFGLIAAFAYNLMRFVALKDNAKHPQFAKALRFRFVHLPCQVVRHAGEVVFKFMDRHFEEVKRWISYFKNIKFGLASADV
jgi:hypothetical protein